MAASTSTVAVDDAEGGEQLAADGFGGARQQLQAAPGRRGQPGGPGEHGVAHALGQRRVRLGEDLADEERVARGAAVDVGRVEPVSVERASATADLLSGVSCSRRASGVATRSPSTGLQRVVGAERVAVRQHQQQRQRGDPAGEEPDEVERRLVAPSAGPRRRTRAGGRAARRAPRRRSRAGRRCRAAGRGPRGRARRATSRSGPSGRGVLSESHMPHSGCAVARVRSTRARRRTVLPMPASPATRTTEPWPSAARRARSSSTSRGCSRSSSRII